MRAKPNHEEYKTMCYELANGEPFTLDHLYRIFGKKEIQDILFPIILQFIENAKKEGTK